MIDPFTLSSIIISYAIHIGHIGYTIYQNAPVIKEEIKKVEEDVIEEIKEEVTTPKLHQARRKIVLSDK